jgi:predicted dehydrogenase
VRGNNTTWKVVIAGLGWIAEMVHLPYLCSSLVVDLLGGYDVDETRTQQMVKRFGLRPFTAWDRLLEAGADVAVIATPPSTHGELVVSALNHHMHVICEKPLATSAKEARAIATASKGAKRHVFCCMTNRYRSDVQRMASAVREARIGEPRFMRASWLRARGVPMSLGALEKGVLWDLGIHLIDLAVWMTGWRNPISVTANQTRIAPSETIETANWYRRGAYVNPKSFGADTATIEVSFKNGAIASVEVSWAAHIPDDRTEILLLGTDAALRLSTVFGWSSSRDLVKGPPLAISSCQEDDWIPLVSKQNRDHLEYKAQLDSFFNSLGGRPNATDQMDELVEVIKIMEAGELNMRRLGD